MPGCLRGVKKTDPSDTCDGCMKLEYLRMHPAISTPAGRVWTPESVSAAAADLKKAWLAWTEDDAIVGTMHPDSIYANLSWIFKVFAVFLCFLCCQLQRVCLGAPKCCLLSPPQLPPWPWCVLVDLLPVFRTIDVSSG